MLRHLIRPAHCSIKMSKRLSGAKSRNILRWSSTGNTDKSMTDIVELDQAPATSGQWEPVWYADEEEEKDVIGNKSTEHFSFDHSKGVRQEPEDERLNFQKYVAKFGEAR